MNTERGDVTVCLEGKDYVLRPSFESMVEIESRTGIGMVALARRAMVGEHGISDMAAVFTAGMKASGDAPKGPETYEKVGRMIFRTGFHDLTQSMIDFLTSALTGGEPPGEA